MIRWIAALAAIATLAGCGSIAAQQDEKEAEIANMTRRELCHEYRRMPEDSWGKDMTTAEVGRRGDMRFRPGRLEVREWCGDDWFF